MKYLDTDIPNSKWVRGMQRWHFGLTSSDKPLNIQFCFMNVLRERAIGTLHKLFCLPQ